MTKPGRFLLIFIAILVESALAVTAGLTAVHLSAEKAVPPGIYAGKVDIGGMDRDDAANRIQAFYENKLAGSRLEIDVRGRGKYYIDYPDIDAAVDGKATVDSIYNIKNPLNFIELFPEYLGFKKAVVNPVIRFDEGKLTAKLLELKNDIDTKPVDARVRLLEGSIIKEPERPGIALNIKNAVEAVKSKISKEPGAPVSLDNSKGGGLDLVNAASTLKDFDFIQNIITSYSTTISDVALNDSIKLSADAIDQAVVPSNTTETKAQVFSFIERLKAKNADVQYDSDGYDQVASTLYAALLTAGIDKDLITRIPHKLAPDYIDPGLDAWITGNAGDLKFSNWLPNKIAILTEIRDNVLTVAIAGSSSDITKKYDIQSVVTQKFDPPIINVVNDDLKKGERLVLSPGEPGLVVEIRRNGELMYTDKYDPVEAMVQVGPGTGFSSDLK